MKIFVILTPVWFHLVGVKNTTHNFRQLYVRKCRRFLMYPTWCFGIWMSIEWSKKMHMSWSGTKALQCHSSSDKFCSMIKTELCQMVNNCHSIIVVIIQKPRVRIHFKPKLYLLSSINFFLVTCLVVFSFISIKWTMSSTCFSDGAKKVFFLIFVRNLNYRALGLTWDVKITPNCVHSRNKP